MPLSQPLRWHGGKNYLAKRIIELFPPHIHYVEPFAGGMAVLLQKDPDGVSEVVNDLNRRLTWFWRVLQCPPFFQEFVRKVQAIPFSEAEWKDAAAGLHSERCRGQCVDCAVEFFVLCRQSLAGRCKSFSGITRTRTRRGMNGDVSGWLSAVEGLPAVHERLQRVLVLNRDALDVICGQDGEQTLQYLDPPYLCSTRTAPDVYQHEMTVEQHHELLTTIGQCVGKIAISGYRNDLYDDLLSEWTRHEFDLPNNAAGGAAKRRMVECLWVNW